MTSHEIHLDDIPGFSLKDDIRAARDILNRLIEYAAFAGIETEACVKRSSIAGPHRKGVKQVPFIETNFDGEPDTIYFLDKLKNE